MDRAGKEGTTLVNFGSEEVHYEPQGMDQTELLAATHPMPAKGVLRPYEAVCCMGDCLAGRGKGVQKS